MPELPNIPIWIGIPIFMGVLVVLVMIHELGHFITAKLANVKVEEFAFGFPPRMLSIRRGETEYSINWLPLGGYVKMLGEEDPGEPRSLASKAAHTRIIIMAAGAVMNFALAILLFALVYVIPNPVVTGRVVVTAVAPESPAAVAGLQANDVITRVDDRTVTSSGDLQKFIQLNLGSPVVVEVERGPRNFQNLVVTPRWAPPAGQGPLGIQIGMANVRQSEVSYPIWEALPLGFRDAADTLTLTRNGIWSWVMRIGSDNTGTSPVSGPVGIYQLTEVVTQVSVATGSIGPVLQLMALISMSLGIFNLLPLPALDGGRILFVLIEILRRGKRISPEREAVVHLAGFVLLLGMILVVSGNEITRLIAGESLIR